MNVILLIVVIIVLIIKYFRGIQFHENIDEMTPRQFEKFIETLFSRMGYSTKLTPQTGDYGGDVIAINENEEILIEVKHYSEGKKVTPKEVQRTLGAMYFYKANKAIFITTSDFTKNAKNLEEGAPIELWNREILLEKIREYY